MNFLRGPKSNLPKTLLAEDFDEELMEQWPGNSGVSELLLFWGGVEGGSTEFRRFKISGIVFIQLYVRAT